METARQNGVHDNVTDVARVLAAARALEPQIKAAVDTMETDRRLPPSLVQAMKEAGIFRMAVAREYGGLELSPAVQVQVIEELSRFDGSVGWCAMIGGAAGYLGGFLAPPVARRLFGHIDGIAAGQVAPMGRADVVAGGYRVTGRWRFASGCQHSTVLMGGCLLYDRGELRRQADGQPEIRLMLMPVSQCTIIDTWQTTGMRGTGSHDFTAEDVFVPAEESVSFFDPPQCPGPLYSLPHLFLVGHTGVPLGIARGAIDTVLELSAQKVMLPARRLLREEGQVQETVAWAEAALGAARSYAYDVIDDLWQTLCRRERPSPRQRSLYRTMMVYVHRIGKDVVEAMYDTASTSAIFQPNPLDRYMRDILTACQHRVVHAKIYRPAGRLLLGLDPGDPFI
jgi:alkylation response protein AidB-like acyl-CoA dehydrogenase